MLDKGKKRNFGVYEYTLNYVFLNIANLAVRTAVQQLTRVQTK